jgi:hypothetical protein
MTSRDFGFTTLRNVTVYNQDGSLVTPGYVYTVGTGGKQVFTNSISLSSLTVSSINGIPYTSSQDSNWTYNSTTSTLSSNSPNVNVTNFSTNTINPSGGNVYIGSTSQSTVINNKLFLNSQSGNDGDTSLYLFNNKVQMRTNSSLFGGVYLEFSTSVADSNKNFNITGENGTPIYASFGSTFSQINRDLFISSGMNLSTNSINMTNGTITGVSTINGSPFNPVQDSSWTYNSTTSTLSSNSLNVNVTNFSTNTINSYGGNVYIGSTSQSTIINNKLFLSSQSGNDGDTSLYLFNNKVQMRTNSSLFGGVYLEFSSSVADSDKNFNITGVNGAPMYASFGSTSSQINSNLFISSGMNLSTNSINMTNGTITGVSTINGEPFDPTQDTHWTYNSSLNTLTNNIGNVNINGYTISSTVPILNVSTNTNRFYVLNNSTSATYNGISIHLDNNQTDPFGGALRFAKTQNFNSTTNNCELGYITFEGTDTNNSTLVGSRVIARQDGTASAGSIAGSLYFDTNAGGSLAYTRMKILSGGDIEMYSSLKVYNNLIASSIGSTLQSTIIYGDVYLNSQTDAVSTSLNLFNNNASFRTNNSFLNGCYLELKNATSTNNQFSISNALGANVYATFGQTRNEINNNLTVNNIGYFSSISTLSTCISINPNSTISSTSGGIIEAYNSNNTVKKPMYINPYGGFVYLGSTSQQTTAYGDVYINSQGDENCASLNLFNNKVGFRTNSTFAGGCFLQLRDSISTNNQFNITGNLGTPMYATFGHSKNEITNILTISSISSCISINPLSTISGISGGILEVYNSNNTVKNPLYINPYGGDIYLGSTLQSTTIYGNVNINSQGDLTGTSLNLFNNKARFFSKASFGSGLYLELNDSISTNNQFNITGNTGTPIYASFGQDKNEINGTLLVNGPAVSRVSTSVINNTNFTNGGTLSSSNYGNYIFVDSSQISSISSLGATAPIGTVIVLRNINTTNILVANLADSTGSTINANRTASYVYYGTGWYGL